MTTKSMSTEGGPVIVHQAFIPLEGPIRSLCGADGRSVLRTADVTCPDCLTSVELGTWRTVFDDEDGQGDEAAPVHKVFIPSGGDARGLCGATSGPVSACSGKVTCPACRSEDGQDADEVELVRADDLAVVEVVRRSGGEPVVRVASADRVCTWTAERARIAVGLLLTIAERELEKDGDEALGMVDVVVDLVKAVMEAVRLIEGAAVAR